jgi:DNA-binding beta-propeller fold protein YncE
MTQSPAPVGVLIDPAGKRAYIATTNADRIVALDLETYKIVAVFSAGSEPDGLGWARMAFRE